VTWLLVNIVSAAAFLNIMKWGQRSKCDMTAMGAFNYAVAAMCFLAIALLRGNPDFSPFALVLGGLVGAAYVSLYFLLNAALRRCGVAITMAVARTSVLLPILASAFIWSEIPSWVQGIGIAIAVAALPLLGSYRRRDAAEPQRARRAWLLLPMLFLINGVASLGFKVCSAEVPEHRLEYLTALFCMAAVTSGGVALSRSGYGSLKEIRFGALLGLANVIPNHAMLMALRTVPGVVAFPVQACGLLVVATLTALVVWGERFSRKTWLGLCMAAIALVLINI